MTSKGEQTRARELCSGTRTEVLDSRQMSDSKSFARDAWSFVVWLSLGTPEVHLFSEMI